MVHAKFTDIREIVPVFSLSLHTLSAFPVCFYMYHLFSCPLHFCLISFHLDSLTQSFPFFLFLCFLNCFNFHLLCSSSFQVCFLVHSFYLYSSPFTCCGFFPLFHFSLCCLFFFWLYFFLSVSPPPSVAVKYQSGGFIPSIKE